MKAIPIKWGSPVQLYAAKDDHGLPYWYNEQTVPPEKAGIYVFSRRWGSKDRLIYVGETANLRKRLIQHLKSNPKLLTALEMAGNGTRLMLWGTVHGPKGLRVKSALAIVQQALIEQAIADGHELVNIQGVQVETVSVLMDGPLVHRGPFNKEIKIKW